MNKLVIVGQAPSRLGDGRPFSGPSGKRLQQLTGLKSYEQLADAFTLENIFPFSADKLTSGRGDEYDVAVARRIGDAKMLVWSLSQKPQYVLACGHQVYKSLTGSPQILFGRRVFNYPAWGGRVVIFNFPHPSGASGFWNEPDNTRKAKHFLAKLLHHLGKLNE